MGSQTLLLDDSAEELIKIRRSSGKKEWVTRETLFELNKQHRLKKATLRAKNDSFLTGVAPKKTNWMAISIWLNGLLLIALSATLLS
jgi:hypothetical protein